MYVLPQHGVQGTGWPEILPTEGTRRQYEQCGQVIYCTLGLFHSLVNIASVLRHCEYYGSVLIFSARAVHELINLISWGPVQVWSDCPLGSMLNSMSSTGLQVVSRTALRPWQEDGAPSLALSLEDPVYAK